MAALEDYDCMNRETAITTVMRLYRVGRIPIGLIYQGEARTLEQIYLKDIAEAPALINFSDGKRKQQVREILSAYGIK